MLNLKEEIITITKYGDRTFFKDKTKIRLNNFFSWYEYKMGKEFLKLHEVEIERPDFYSSKSGITRRYVNISKIILSNEFLSSKMVFRRLQK